ncbi:restriction endonuclease subunit S [Collinsella sp. zg1085]|uniref:restriction endonuclease subunit S n=1 Tax=Collinsella sp. zg1085 TaxID=2844380 RepID=UPI001C0B121D|nr:restriction endonuclease subunit S [Collinsella sp. zg1085]QWT17337.1 restriction endonuclease subunit S [Collinsella sp. zg1085]
MRYKHYVAGRLSELEYKDIPALDEKEWAEFRIGDLFEVSRPTARNKDNYQAGGVPFVASGSVNNGVMKLCEPLDDEPLDKGRCITVSPVDGSTFYQPMDFLGRGGAGSSILMLRSDNLNLYRGQLMARAIQQTCSKYTYGHMGNKDSIKRERIMLPVNDASKPDYAYMEQYAKNMMFRKYRAYLNFIEREIDDIERERE